MRILASLAALLLASVLMPGQLSAQAPAAGNLAEQTPPIASPILPLRERAQLEDRWLAERLDTVVPQLMRAQGIDMWVLIAREYVEDPVVATMLDAESFHARRRTILLFFDPGKGQPVERLTVSRYGMGDLFQPAWIPEQEPGQWKQLAKLIVERQPQQIAINSSALSQFGDGLTLSQYEGMVAALPAAMRERIVKTDALAVGWLETRIAAEMAAYPGIVRLAHTIIAEALSSKVIEPGTTTADDVVWWMREKVAALGLQTWFQPSIGILRHGEPAMLEGDTVIQPGDMLWTDFGITYLGLNTDTQHLAYVLKDGESEAPAGLTAGLRAANATQDALTSSFKAGLTGNAILAEARRKAIAQGLEPSIYSHPIGYHGHGAGSNIGFWDNQQASPQGEHRLRANTAWSIELSAKHAVPEWGNQKVEFRLEEDAFFDGQGVRYLDGRQSEFHLIGK